MSQTTFYLLLDTADELTEPHAHVERVPYWDTNRHRRHREHRTTQPGLLAQLYDAAVDPVKVQQEGGGKTKQASRPPLAIEAFSRYSDVCTAALRWTTSIRVKPRPTVESNIRALVGVASRFDLDTLEALYQEMKTWHRWAAVMTGWQSQVFKPRISCPICDSRGSIYVNGVEQLAYCGECQSHWEGEELVEMAERVRVAA